MLRTIVSATLSAVCLLMTASVFADEPSADPKPIPQTRLEAKQALEDLKHRQPRLPLPEPTAEERERAGSSGFGLVNNGRMRALYLPEELRPSSNRPRSNNSQRDRSQRGRAPSDPNMTLDYAFTVELFWIASRANNCHYCLGHQETKLRSAGLSEERVAALDSSWVTFSPAEQAAYELARKLTLEPHLLSDGDFAGLHEHYTPLQILEIIYHVARYNATNRWTDSLGIPQEDHREFLTETPAQYASLPSIVAPRRIPDRGKLPSRDEAIDQLAKCRSRTARVPVTDEATARQILGEERFAGPIPQWARLLANFPNSGKSTVESQLVLMEKGLLSRELKAEINWVAARHDRAWYALGQAAGQLAELGYDEDRMFALDNPQEHPKDSHRVALGLAAKLTASPQAIADADIAALRDHFSDSEVAEIVYRITQAAFFNRLTEATALPLEDSGS